MVTPSLHSLGTDFGNGTADRHLFQFDQDFSRFRENKLLCRAEYLPKYVCEANFSLKVQEAVSQLLQRHLATEHPALFSRMVRSDNSSTLICHLTGETLWFDSQGRLRETAGPGSGMPPYADAIDALCCQFPEDLAVVCRDADTADDWLAKLHLCAPSHWAASAKIGKAWDAAHAPVPGMDKSRRAAGSLIGVIIERKPMVRFTWGIEFTDRLNHHPEPPPGTDTDRWNHRGLNHTAGEPFFLRVERQVIWGLPEVNAAVFTVRIYNTPGSVLRANAARREALRSALLSMTEESRRYKGLSNCMEGVLAYLSG